MKEYICNQCKRKEPLNRWTIDRHGRTFCMFCIHCGCRHRIPQHLVRGGPEPPCPCIHCSIGNDWGVPNNGRA